MKKILVAIVLGLLLLEFSANVVLADGMVLPDALSPDYVTVREHHVTVTIEDNHAITRVEQEFYNPHDVAVTGRYLFPIPPDAILSGFEASVNGQRQTITRQDANTTNKALQTTIVQQNDPSLLQYADWESLAFDLTLPAHGTRRMTLQYEEILTPQGGMLHYRYILSTERYSAQALDAVSIAVDLHSSTDLGAIYAATHDVETERLGPQHARVHWEAHNTLPMENFDLYFSPSKDGFSSGLLTGRRVEQEHFLFLFAPEATTDPQARTLPKDIMFIIDRSGSMSGEKIIQAQDALTFILEQLNENDRFSIVGFDNRLEVFSSSLQNVERSTIRQAQRFVRHLDADGNTDLEGALQAGLNILDDSTTQTKDRADAARLVVFLTDGLPTAGVTDGHLIADLVTRRNAQVGARLHVFGVGYDVNSHLLDRLAADNGGSVTYVLPDENLEAVLTDFYGQIANPLLTDIEIAFDGMVVEDVYPQNLPDMFQGSSLLLTGRYRAKEEDVSITVRGGVGSEAQTYTYTFDIGARDQHDFVPRLWATRHIGSLLDRIRVEGESTALVEEVRTLGLNYGLVTPYTTLVIAAQETGAASADNMSLYDNQSELNAVSGRTTIAARVQNQAYQQSERATLATGANVQNIGPHSLAQISYRQVDLTLLREQDDPNTPVDDTWLKNNITVDRQVSFGSKAYFALAQDAEIRPYLQSGTNVLFTYKGEVIEIQGPDTTPSEGVNTEPPPTSPNTAPDPNIQRGRSSLIHVFFRYIWEVLSPNASRSR